MVGLCAPDCFMDCGLYGYSPAQCRSMCDNPNPYIPSGKTIPSILTRSLQVKAKTTTCNRVLSHTTHHQKQSWWGVTQNVWLTELMSSWEWEWLLPAVWSEHVRTALSLQKPQLVSNTIAILLTIICDLEGPDYTSGGRHCWRRCIAAGNSSAQCHSICSRRR